MNTRIGHAWERLRSSYWFVPAMMASGAAGLAFAMLALDSSNFGERAQAVEWIYAGGPEGAWTLLSTLAGSMITVTGVTFSITVVVLALASSQFGPRLLANFTRDTGSQAALGAFLATFVYYLLILRTIRGGEGGVFVPHLSVTLGLALAILSVGVLIYYIHHISAAIQAENIIDAIGRDLDEAIERLFPGKSRHGPLELELRRGDDIPKGFDEEAQPIAALRSGYLQAVDQGRLLRLAQESQAILRLQHRPGDFVASGGELVEVWPAGLREEDFVEQVNEAFIIGAQRLSIQDVEYAVNQLVEIAVRALSPAINDPFTAMACVDRLGAALAHLAERSIPSAYRYDDAGQLRLITARPVTFDGVTDAALNQIRQSARANIAVTIRLLEAVAIAAAPARSDTRRAVLLRHADMIRRGSDEVVREASDRNEIEERYQRVLEALEEGRRRSG